MSPYVRVQRTRRLLRRPSRRTVRNSLLMLGCALVGTLLSVALGSTGWWLSQHFAQEQVQLRIACHRQAELVAPAHPGGGYFSVYLQCMSGRHVPEVLAPPAVPAAGPSAAAKPRNLLDRLVTIVRVPFKILQASLKALGGGTDTRR